MKTTILSGAFILFLALCSIAQDASKTNLGLGIGLDYGGIGTRFMFLPSERIGLFGGLGYNLATVGYNVGAQFRFSTEKRIDWFITGMYGYNGVIKVTGAIESNETYYGPTFGGGIELKSGRNDKSFWNFELLVPIRSSEFNDDLDNWKMLADVTEPLPIAFSIGYHIRF